MDSKEVAEEYGLSKKDLYDKSLGKGGEDIGE